MKCEKCRREIPESVGECVSCNDGIPTGIPKYTRKGMNEGSIFAGDYIG